MQHETTQGKPYAFHDRLHARCCYVTNSKQDLGCVTFYGFRNILIIEKQFQMSFPGGYLINKRNDESWLNDEI